MLLFESKLDGMQQQYDALDEAIRTAAAFVIAALNTGKKIGV